VAKQENAISPTRKDDYPEWYQQVIKASDMAENSPVRGCMVIKPWGYGVWENIQRVLDGMFKDTGHVNAYFPLFIPLSFFEKEAEHVEGFAKECAVVTHHRLEPKPGGGLRPAGELEEPLIVRPTSETIIGAAFAKWTQSYRDLPILINQWANVVRWEMRTRLFLRTAEFLWQEGHTVHATEAEAREETLKMLDVYEQFVRETMAMPAIKGEKCSWERFPGAVNTYAIESMMQDRKALQAGTSHFLGQNFAKASEIKFLGKDGAQEYAWTTSWGVSTRLIGGLIMTHGDDDGLVLPPRLAPKQAVILPIYRNDDERATVLEFCRGLMAELRQVPYAGGKLAVELDDRDLRGGEKTWQHIKRGVPLRLEVGPRDVAAGSVFLGRRDKAHKDKQSVPRGEIVGRIVGILDEMQQGLYDRALAFQKEHTRVVTDRRELDAWFTPKNEDKPEIHGGFALCPFVDDPRVGDVLKDMKMSVRCMPLDQERKPATCIITGQKTDRWAIFAKSY
jgi:prolyl-tRNA synthetase